MTAEDLILVIPEKSDVERDAVADAWCRSGGAVTRIGRFWDPPPLERTAVRLYGNETFCLVLAQKLGLELVSPADDLILAAPATVLRRAIRRVRLGDTSPDMFPTFAEPIVPKQFAAGVFPDLDALAGATVGLSPDVELIVSGTVDFVAEARAFVLDRTVRACATYEGEGDLSQATRLVQNVIDSVPLPDTAVVDVGLLPGGDWALVELNAAWG
ncbi:MAG TPA: ATP-grasp domain-containing protein, partial [Coriobacteriia bacterium]|nr:ATP-grasp domain-containing protein [Coriobacteriia bacterium]